MTVGLRCFKHERRFRRELAHIRKRLYLERVCASGMPICPEFPDRIDRYRQQNIICL